MGLGIELQDEHGERLESAIDPTNLLGRLLPPNDDRSYPMLASIDPYGDTVFNLVQIERFLVEWAAISTTAKSSEERSRQLLQLGFRNRAIYQYFGVPALVHEALLGAPSKGSYFNQTIRGYFPYSRVRGFHGAARRMMTSSGGRRPENRIAQKCC
jgi:hypothetical protein